MPHRCREWTLAKRGKTKTKVLLSAATAEGMRTGMEWKTAYRPRSASSLLILFNAIAYDLCRVGSRWRGLLSRSTCGTGVAFAVLREMKRREVQGRLFES